MCSDEENGTAEDSEDDTDRALVAHHTASSTRHSATLYVWGEAGEIGQIVTILYWSLHYYTD